MAWPSSIMRTTRRHFLRNLIGGFAALTLAAKVRIQPDEPVKFSEPDQRFINLMARGNIVAMDTLAFISAELRKQDFYYPGYRRIFP